MEINQIEKKLKPFCLSKTEWCLMAYVSTGAKIKNDLKENYKFIQLPTPLSKKKKKSVNNMPL